MHAGMALRFGIVLLYPYLSRVRLENGDILEKSYYTLLLISEDDIKNKQEVHNIYSCPADSTCKTTLKICEDNESNAIILRL